MTKIKYIVAVYDNGEIIGLAANGLRVVDGTGTDMVSYDFADSESVTNPSSSSERSSDD